MVFFVPIKKTDKATLCKFDLHYLKMETVVMNTEDSKTSEPNIFKLDLTGKHNLKNPKKNIAFSQFKYLLHLEKY